MKVLISSAFAEQLDLQKSSTAESDANKNAKDGACLLSLVQAHPISATATITATAPPQVTTATPKVPPTFTLKSILKRASSGRH